MISIPPLGITTSLPPPSVGDGPPGVDEPAPPGSTTPPPGFADLMPRQIPTLGGTVDTSVPPPTSVSYHLITSRIHIVIKCFSNFFKRVFKTFLIVKTKF